VLNISDFHVFLIFLHFTR